MAQITGEITAKLGEAEYRLRLTNRALGQLQDEYGTDLKPITDIPENGLPHFGVLVRVVELSLQRHHKDLADAADVADDLLAQDMGLFTRLITAAFPALAGMEGKKRGAAGKQNPKKPA